MSDYATKYLVTGATGNVGSLVADKLIALGQRPRVFVRDSNKAYLRFGDRAEVAIGDLANSRSLAAALAGVDTVFLITSGPDLAAQDEAAAHQAVAAGVKHLIKLSSLDAKQKVGTGVWHAAGEEAIRARGVPFTFVQPTGFMANALWWAGSIKKDGVVRACTGDGRIPFVHSRDIAEVVVKTMLANDDFVGQSLAITGPEALTYAEMTDHIGVAIGRRLQFEPISESEARDQQAAWGAADRMIEARLSIFRAIREGRLAETTNTIDRVLGRQPISFAVWAQENAAAFV